MAAGRSKSTKPKSRSSGSATVSSGDWKYWVSPRLFGRQLPWYWSLIFLAVLLVVSDLSLRNTLRSTAYAMLSPLDSIGETRVRNVGYSLTGHLHVYGTTLEFGDNSEGIRVGDIDLETPGFWWVAQQVLPKGKPSKASKLFGAVGGGGDWYYPETPKLSLYLRDVNWGDYSVGHLITDIDWVGSYTGALFEAEGCPEDAYWTSTDLSERLALDPGSGDIEIRYEVIGDRKLARRVHFGNDHLSELIIESEYELPGPAKHWLDLLWYDWRTTKIRWTVTDHGFVAKRNQWCAEQAKVDVTTLVDRHIASVQRVLAANGLKADDTLMQAYRGYASEGQSLVWETHLSPGLALEDYAEKSYDSAMAALAPTLTVGGHAVAYTMAGVAEKPMPDYAVSVWELIEIESGRRPRPGTSADTAAPAAVAASESPSAVTTTVTPTSAPADPSLSVEHLEKAIGLRVQLGLEGHRKMIGVVEAVDKKLLHMKISMGGGYAQVEVNRERIASIRRY